MRAHARVLRLGSARAMSRAGHDRYEGAMPLLRAAALLLLVTGAVADYARALGEGPLGMRYTGDGSANSNTQWGKESPEAHGFSSEALQARRRAGEERAWQQPA